MRKSRNILSNVDLSLKPVKKIPRFEKPSTIFKPIEDIKWSFWWDIGDLPNELNITYVNRNNKNSSSRPIKKNILNRSKEKSNRNKMQIMKNKNLINSIKSPTNRSNHRKLDNSNTKTENNIYENRNNTVSSKLTNEGTINKSLFNLMKIAQTEEAQDIQKTMNKEKTEKDKISRITNKLYYKYSQEKNTHLKNCLACQNNFNCEFKSKSVLVKEDIKKKHPDDNIFCNKNKEMNFSNFIENQSKWKIKKEENLKLIKLRENAMMNEKCTFKPSITEYKPEGCRSPSNYSNGVDNIYNEKNNGSVKPVNTFNNTIQNSRIASANNKIHRIKLDKAPTTNNIGSSSKIKADILNQKDYNNLRSFLFSFDIGKD